MKYKSDELFDALPTGAKFESNEDKVINWVDQGEDAMAKTYPAAVKRDNANEEALKKAYIGAVHSANEAIFKWEAQDKKLENTVKHTVESTYDYLDKKGTVAEAEKLEDDIEAIPRLGIHEKES